MRRCSGEAVNLWSREFTTGRSYQDRCINVTRCQNAFDLGLRLNTRCELRKPGALVNHVTQDPVSLWATPHGRRLVEVDSKTTVTQLYLALRSVVMDRVRQITSLHALSLVQIHMHTHLALCGS